MTVTIAIIVFYLLVPAVLIWLTTRFKALNKIGVVVLAYIIGLIIGNIGILPKAGPALRGLTIASGSASLSKSQIQELLAAGTITSSDVIANQISSVVDLLMSISILIAIPLLLFSFDLKNWTKRAGEAVKSMILGLISILAAVVAGFFIWKNVLPESWKISGMLVGIYTGGTPNLAAIATALNVNPNTFIIINTYDLILGALCLFFLMTVAQRLFNLILPKFKKSENDVRENISGNMETEISEEFDSCGSYRELFRKENVLPLLFVFLLSLVVVAISYGLGSIVTKTAQMTVIILSITTLGILLSLIKRVNHIKYTFQLGMYFIYIFSLAVSSTADLKSMLQIEYLDLFLYVMLTVFGSMIIHVLLSKIFKVDADTTIIAIVALTYSPPFVPAVAASIRNKELIISGLTVGILGYVIGNYLGVSVAYILKGFLINSL